MYHDQVLHSDIRSGVHRQHLTCRLLKTMMTTTCGMRGAGPVFLPRGPAWMKQYRMCSAFLSGKRKASLPKASKVRFATLNVQLEPD